MAEIRFGIVGMGTRGRIFADTVGQNPYATLTAIADSSAEKLQAAEQAYDAHAYTRFEDMLDREELDAVVVATPDFLHKEPVMLATERGCHILVEKPFATSARDAEEMHSAISASGITCMVAFENRWNAPFVAAKEAIASGELGRIIAMNSSLNDTIYVPMRMLLWASRSSPGWFLLPHSVDIACWLKEASPTQVFAVGTHKKLVAMGLDTYDSIQATITFEDDASGTFTSSWVLPEAMPSIYGFRYEIIGEDGALYVDLPGETLRKATGHFEHVPVLGMPIHGRLKAPPSLMLHDFIDNVRLGTEPLATSYDGLLNTRLVELIHKSIEMGTVQKL